MKAIGASIPYSCFALSLIKQPTTYVDRNISANGIQVPIKLQNISKLLSTNKATTNTSKKMANSIKNNPVVRGLVKLNILK
jgi:hypothetical protein